MDTSKGHKQLLENSGLVPKYTKKKVIFFIMFSYKKCLLRSFQKNRKYSQNNHSLEQQGKMAGTYENPK